MRRTRTSRVTAGCTLVLFSAVFVAAAARSTGAENARAANVHVVGAVGQKPTLQFTTPLSVTKSSMRVLHREPGTRAVRGQRVSYQFLLVDGRTGLELATSYGGRLASLVVDRAQSNPALVKSMVGATAGSRYLVSVAPRDGIARSYTSLGAQARDTLIFVIDVVSVHPRLTDATGTPVPLPTGLPHVDVASSGRTRIAAPAGSPPVQLVVQPLIRGTGSTVVSGQSVTIQETGIIWAGGQTFVDTRARGGPSDTPLGTGQSLPAFDAGLIGQTVGSRVMLVVPPAEGFGPNGAAQFGIAGTDTLVYVIDILDAY